MKEAKLRSEPSQFVLSVPSTAPIYRLPYSFDCLKAVTLTNNLFDLGLFCFCREKHLLPLLTDFVFSEVAQSKNVGGVPLHRVKSWLRTDEIRRDP